MSQQTFLLQVDDELNVGPKLEPLDDPIPIDEITQSLHHLSLNAMKGSFGVGTIRFTGQIAGLTIQVLVDGGSSDNFLQPRLAHFLHLPIEPTHTFNVLVGNGQTMEPKGIVHNFTVTI